MAWVPFLSPNQQLQALHWRQGYAVFPKIKAIMDCCRCHSCRSTNSVKTPEDKIIKVNENTKLSNEPTSGRSNADQFTPVGQCGPIPVRINSLPSVIKPHSAYSVAENVENVSELTVRTSSTVAGPATSCSLLQGLAPADVNKQKMEPLLCNSQIPTTTGNLSHSSEQTHTDTV